MSETKKPAKSTKKIMDVAHPGKSAPAASGRPVIVTNRPILKDPMVREDPDAKPVLPEVSTQKVSREVAIKPTEAPEKEKTIAQLAEEAKARADQAEAEKADEKTKAVADKASNEPEPDAKPETEPVAKQDETPVQEKEAEVTKPEDDTTDTSTPGAEQAAEESAQEAEAAKRDADLEKLVESKEYFVAINSVEKRRTKRVVVLGIVLSVLLALAWVDIALDAGIIQLDSVKPLTHFFSN